jgi:hypothetical protein
MRRTTVNLILDGVAALLMMGLVYTGIIIRFVLPPGSNKDRSLWDLSRHQWGDLHFWLAVALLLVVFLHMANHWTWVIAVTVGRRGGAGKPVASGRTRWLSGLLFMLVLVGSVSALSWLAWRHAQPAGDAREPARTGTPKGKAAAELHGAMTLSEAAHATGLSLGEVKKRLRVPDSVGDGETLGRLGRQYGFAMGEARQRLEETPPGDSGRP